MFMTTCCALNCHAYDYGVNKGSWMRQGPRGEGPAFPPLWAGWKKLLDLHGFPGTLPENPCSPHGRFDGAIPRRSSPGSRWTPHPGSSRSARLRRSGCPLPCAAHCARYDGA